MATYLKARDLATLMRSRKDVNPRILADWIEENPEHPAVMAEIDRVEESLLRLADWERCEDCFIVDNVITFPTLLTRIYAVLSIAVPTRAWDYGSNLQPLVDNATHMMLEFVERSLPAICAHVTKRLRPYATAEG